MSDADYCTTSCTVGGGLINSGLWLLLQIDNSGLRYTIPFPSPVKVLETRFSEYPPLVDPLPQPEHHCLQHLLLTRGGGGREVHRTQAREGPTKIRGCEHCRKGYSINSVCICFFYPDVNLAAVVSLGWRLVLNADG